MHQQNLRSFKKVDLNDNIEKNIKLAIINAQSVRNKTADFVHHVIEENYDLTFVCETWLNEADGHVVASLAPTGYNFQYVNRESETRGGGIGVMYKEDIKVVLVSRVSPNLWNMQCGK